MPTAIQNLHTSEQHDIDVGITAVALSPASATDKTLFAIDINNADNVHDVHLKIYDVAAPGPTVGTTAPIYDLFVAAGEDRPHVFNMALGLLATEVLYAVCVKEGGTTVTNPPDEDVKVTVWTN